MTLSRRVVLEVERKFRGLAVPVLTRTAGDPPFRRLQPLPDVVLHDAYYDRADGALAAAGAWVRRRNGAWEAKVRCGHGSNNSSEDDLMRNSRFEELQGAAAVAACVRRLTGEGASADQPLPLLAANPNDGPNDGPNGHPDDDPDGDGHRPFGLQPLAAFVTRRQAWRADDGFTIVLDATDFGHTVGEVELEATLELAGAGGDAAADAAADAARKAQAAAALDARIAAFMQTYAWAFLPGAPTGKLTAYFALVRAGKLGR